jgi:hypothetical protein
VVVALIAVPSCSALPRADTVQHLTRPSVTAETASAIVKQYNEIRATADARRSDELIAGVQTGDLLRQTEASYKIGRALEQRTARPAPFVLSSVGAPEYGGYPMRFVASGNDRLGVWERRSAGNVWRSTVELAPDTGQKAPDVTGAQDLAATDPGGAVASPAVAASELASYLTTGATSPHARLFSVHPAVSKLLKQLADSHAWAAQQTRETIEVTDTFTVNAPPAAFRTSSGEVLAFFTLTEAHLMRTTDGSGSMWAAGFGVEAFAPVNQVYPNALTSSTLHQVAIAIPTSKGAKIRVLALKSQLVDAGGY